MTTTPTPRPPSAAPQVTAFPDALREAAEIASLSPSSHNCQPWAVARLASPGTRRAAARLLGAEVEEADTADTADTAEPGSDNGSRPPQYLALALDRERQLDSLPAHAVEMLLSCGLYWQLLLRALAAQGWTADRVRFSDEVESDGASAGAADTGAARALGAAWPANWSLLCVVRLRHGGPAHSPAAESLAELRATAQARRTNRAPYHPDAVEPALLEGLLTPSTAAAEGAQVTVRHLRAESERARFADFVARHGGRDFSHRSAWRETHSFLRWSPADAEARGDGFTLAQLFGPLSRLRHLAMRVALAPATLRVLRHVGYHRLLAHQLAAVVRPSPVIVVMSFSEAAPSLGETVRGGARLADYWLRATAAGLVLHPVSVVLQHDDLRTELQSWLRLPGRAFFVSRLGRPTAAFPRAPRRAATTAFRTI